MKGVVLDDVALLLSEVDTVATALDDLVEGHTIEHDEDRVVLADDVPFGHKLALKSIDEGDSIYKYGEVIGRATQRIKPGEWVHTHNCESTRGRGDLSTEEVAQ